MVPAAVQDTLVRLLERQPFLARWTDEIIEETVRTLEHNRGRTHEPSHEGKSCPRCGGSNALQSDPHLQSRRLSESTLKPFGIKAAHPDKFLIDLSHLDGEVVVHEHHEQGTARSAWPKNRKRPPRALAPAARAYLCFCREDCFERLVQPARLVRRPKREVRFRGGYSGLHSNAGQVVYVRTKLVRKLSSATVLLYAEDGRSYREDAEPWLAGSRASRPFRARTRHSSFRETRHHHHGFQQAVKG